MSRVAQWKRFQFPEICATLILGENSQTCLTSKNFNLGTFRSIFLILSEAVCANEYFLFVFLKNLFFFFKKITWFPTSLQFSLKISYPIFQLIYSWFFESKFSLQASILKVKLTKFWLLKIWKEEVFYFKADWSSLWAKTDWSFSSSWEFSKHFAEYKVVRLVNSVLICSTIRLNNFLLE